MSQKYVEIPRHLYYLNSRRIVYRQDPVNDVPTIETEQYKFYAEGTYECYHLFNSKAKITTYRSLKWHLLVLRYLNPNMSNKEFKQLAEAISIYKHGFITFSISTTLLNKIIIDVELCDLEEPPRNKLRKVIFKPYCKLELTDKLKIVGKLIGRKRITEDQIYLMMLDINDSGAEITIQYLADLLSCSKRTIYRNISNQLKNEIKILNEEI